MESQFQKWVNLSYLAVAALAGLSRLYSDAIKSSEPTILKLEFGTSNLIVQIGSVVIARHLVLHLVSERQGQSIHE